ncbi:MAG: polysaccharide biosynthesis tyrosine autokinase [Pseudomonadota bacterium]
MLKTRHLTGFSQLYSLMAVPPPSRPSGSSGRFFSEGRLGTHGLIGDDSGAFYKTSDRGEQIRGVFDLLLRGKWYILGALLLVALPVAIYSLMLPNQYRAYSLLRVEPKEGSSIEELFSSSMSLGFGRNPDRFLSNEMLVLRQSLLLGERSAARLMEYEHVPGSEAELTILTDEYGEMLPERIVALRLQGLYIAVGPEGRDVDAIRISATSTVPQEAALIANVYAEEYIKRSRETSRASVTASRAFLEDQVGKRSQELQQLDDDVRAFMAREGAIALDQESAFLVQQVSELEAMRDESAIELQLRQATLGALSDELEAIRPNLADRLASGIDLEIEAAQERKAELEVQIQQIYLRNPDLRAQPATGQLSELQTELTQVRRRLRSLSDAYVEETLAVGGMNATSDALAQVAQLQRQVVDGRIEMTGLQARLGVLDERILDYERQLDRIPGQAIELAQLQRARQSAEQTYLLLVDKLQELRVAEESDLGYAEVIRPALTPGAPVSPNRLYNIVLGIVVGLGLGILAAVLKTRLDNRIHRPDDLRDMGETVIGVVPNMDATVKRDFAGKDMVSVEGHQFDTRLVTVLNPLATVSEAYRGLRTNIQFARPDTVIRTMLITSASPAEGKSITAANLAVVMAQAGRRVLLVDADLRRPTIHRKLGLAKEPGLRELLFESKRFDPEAHASSVENLYIVTAGGSTPNPSELLGSKRMRDMIEVFHEHFDVVVFDVPPVLAATDAVLLSTQCDAVVVVAAASKTKTYEVEHALSALRNVGAPVIGTLLNGFDASKAYGYSYKYRYGYANYYGYSYKPSGLEAPSSTYV